MNAYADRLAIDVVCAPLAEIDRRTLSQAWYSALNLARDVPAPKPRLGIAAGAQPTSTARTLPKQTPDRVPTVANAPHPSVHEPDSGVVQGARGERRRLASPLARTIERALIRAQAPRARTTVTLAGRSGRVELLVRSSGAVTHVIAVCAPSAHARVVQALAHARFALARRGVALQARAQGSSR